MRIYEGSPRQDFEEVLRSIGAYMDQRGLKDILLMEAPDGFIVQGLAHVGGSSGAWTDAVGQVEKETMTFIDDDIGRFMDEAAARRGSGAQENRLGVGRYEHTLRAIGRYLDEQHPRDIFFFEQDGAFVVRLHQMTNTGSRHSLVEFTRDDLEALINRGPTLRLPTQPTGPQGAAKN